jgi:hypothetical protein
MTSEGLGDRFEGDSADMCAGKFSLVSMGGRAEGIACANPGARTPMALAEFFLFYYLCILIKCNSGDLWVRELCNLRLYCFRLFSFLFIHYIFFLVVGGGGLS